MGIADQRKHRGVIIVYNVLICDDENDIVKALELYLSAEGYKCFGASNGSDATRVVKSNDIHLILLDIMMPNKDGYETLKELREFSNIPVIFITARSEDTDKVVGLNLGADDYITKPFNPAEVTARVRSALRRYFLLGGGEVKSCDIKIGGILLEDESKRVTVDGEEIFLTKREYEILRFLMTNKGRVYSPREIYKSVWKEDPFGAESVVPVHIRHLREKLEIDPQNPRYLKVIWGQGYKIQEDR